MLNKLNIKQAKEGLAKKEFSSVELTQACLDAIARTDDKLNVFVTLTAEGALKDAKRADEIFSNSTIEQLNNFPLLGIPLTIKDNFSTKGIRTTASAKVLDTYIPPFDSTVVSKLKDAGMVMLGKTNMDAWAHGSSTETSDYGATRNPWNTEHLPGGSSGGAAAAVAANQTIASIGSETAGSIRQPASWCGVVGLKPTYGRVSRYGVAAMGSSLDSPGPITKTTEDSALILEVLAGQDKMDATTSPKDIEAYVSQMKAEGKPFAIGVAEEYFNGVETEVAEKVREAIRRFEKMGAKIETIKLFDPKYAIDVYTIIQRSEVSSNLGRYDGIRYANDRDHFGEEAKRRIMFGTHALSSGYYDQYYNKASKVRTVIIDDFKSAFEKVDLIMAPTSPTLALPVGATKDSAMFGELADVLVEPSSIAGLSGINIPVGFASNNLPIGLQIIGPQFAETKVLQAAYQYEQETQDEEWRKREPSL